MTFNQKKIDEIMKKQSESKKLTFVLSIELVDESKMLQIQLVLSYKYENY